MILGLFASLVLIKKGWNKFLIGYIGLFLAALVDLMLIFYSFKGIASFVIEKNSMNFFLIWLINFIFIVVIGLVAGAFGLLINFVINQFQKT